MKQKKYSVLKGDLIFAEEEGVALGASPSFDACTSWIFSWGDMGISKLELFSILQLISLFSNPYT
jgi:hypothetical protein